MTRTTKILFTTRRHGRSLGLTIAFILSSVCLSATPITGRLIVNGTSLAAVNLTTTDFNYSGSGAPSDTTFGTFLVGPGSTGSFAAFVNDAGTDRSFNKTDVPLGTPTHYTNFIVIPSPGTAAIEFVLTQLIPGAFTSTECTAAPAAGQTCTPNIPGGSPFNLSNTDNGAGGTNAHAEFDVDVEAINLLTGETSNGVGTFSTDFSNANYQELLATILAGGVVTSGAHGDFTLMFTAIPEPTSAGLLLGGLLALGAGLFRKRAQKR